MCFNRVDRIAKMIILTPSQVEQLEKMMILGKATQKDGVKLINSHRCLQAKVDRLEKENEKNL